MLTMSWASAMYYFIHVLFNTFLNVYYLIYCFTCINLLNHKPILVVVTHNVPVHELERGTCREISPVDYTLGKIKC